MFVRSAILNLDITKNPEEGRFLLVAFVRLYNSKFRHCQNIFTIPIALAISATVSTNHPRCTMIIYNIGSPRTRANHTNPPQSLGPPNQITPPPPSPPPQSARHAIGSTATSVGVDWEDNRTTPHHTSTKSLPPMDSSRSRRVKVSGDWKTIGHWMGY